MGGGNETSERRGGSRERESGEIGERAEHINAPCGGPSSPARVRTRRIIPLLVIAAGIAFIHINKH